MSSAHGTGPGETGDAPLVDTSQSKISGNVTARQMEALPLNGRNWMQLTTLTPGSRANAVTDTPFASWPGAFQVNMEESFEAARTAILPLSS